MFIYIYINNMCYRTGRLGTTSEEDGGGVSECEFFLMYFILFFCVCYIYVYVCIHVYMCLWV